MNNPLVSIIIPTYNRAHLIGETLDSVLAQTYTHWECIVVDDGSTDNTEAIVNEYIKKDSRFQYHKRPNYKPKGANACRNYGFELSNGEFVNWVDSDDLVSENKLEEQVALINTSNPDVVTCKWAKFLQASTFTINELEIYKNYDVAIQLLKDYGQYLTFFPSHVFLVKKEVVMKSGLWNEYLKINQDGEFFCRLLIVANTIAFSKNAYVLYRLPNSENTSVLSSEKQAKHLVISWKLIQQNLELIDEEQFKSYIDLGKNYSFGKINKKFPNIIFQNKIFFSEQIKKNSLINRIIKKFFKK